MHYENTSYMQHFEMNVLDANEYFVETAGFSSIHLLLRVSESIIFENRSSILNFEASTYKENTLFRGFDCFFTIICQCTKLQSLLLGVVYRYATSEQCSERSRNPNE